MSLVATTSRRATSVPVVPIKAPLIWMSCGATSTASWATSSVVGVVVLAKAGRAGVCRL